MPELWQLVWGKSEIDPKALFQAIEQKAGCEDNDFRTRVLIRDGTEALEQFWGKQRLNQLINQSQVCAKIEAIQKENLGKPGFPSLRDKLVDSTSSETVKEFLRELGSRIDSSVTLEIGGAIALILTGHLSRATSDINVVNEIPAGIRNERELLQELQKRYGLMLTHFQSHYLPSGWETRLQYIDSFASLKAYVVDVYDIFLGKLFSARTKDLDDLRMLKAQLDKDNIKRQLLANTSALIAESSLKQTAEKNWYILFGESLPGHQG
jgi:hypothetical protein